MDLLMRDATHRVVATRDITLSECPWLNEGVLNGQVMILYNGPTYGCISPNGVAVTFTEGGPFFEVPRNAIKSYLAEY